MRTSLTRILVGAVAVAVIAALPAQDATAGPKLFKTADLKFGSVIMDNVNPGTVTISPAGVRTCGAPLTCFGSVSAAGFETDSDGDGTIFIITLPNSVTLTSAANSMTVDTFTDSEGGSAPAGGQDELVPFTVGATLHVGAGQTEGTYTGTFTVTVNYQ